MKNQKENHHLKLKNELPAWLYFSFFPAGTKPKNVEENTKMALRIKGKLKEFLKIHDIENDVITEPNNYDCCLPYSSNPKEKQC